MQTVLEAIARSVATRPDAVALCRAGHCLTYAELDARAWAIAEELRRSGVSPGDVVAVWLPRGFDQVAGMLGATRAGAAYAPCDPGWPLERVRAVLADCGSKVLLGRAELRGSFERVWVLDPGELGPGKVVAGCEQRAITVSGNDLAYVIYTSGSTGTPKGVEITHDNLQHLIAWHTEAFEVTAEDRASHLAGLGFDASVWEVWPYLAAGATVVLAGDGVRTSPELLVAWLAAERITMAFVPTPLAEPMIGMEWPEETALRYLLTGGDVLHVAPRAGLPFAVVNNYGPAECTVVATSGVVLPDAEGLPSIGRAIAGARVYVLDPRGAVLADGEVGELCIGGNGVGRGYRGQPELTAASFVVDTVCGGESTPSYGEEAAVRMGHPVAIGAAAGGRMYRTGDLAARLPGGEIVFRGRVDGQVKIRGQRLELDEIVCVLDRHPGVVSSAVRAVGVGSEKRLVGYVVGREEESLTAQELSEFLAERLPGYMVPAVYVGLERMPLNANGKVDHPALPLPTDENRLAEEAAREPQTPVEEAVLEIVRRLVKSESVGVEDDFFLVGGHSLLGTQLVMRVRESFGVPLTLRDLFEGATAARLAARVEELLMEELAGMSEEEAERRVAA